MKVTGVGHAGIFVETRAGTVLCDPWVSGAYFASWFPFPDNADLDWDRFGACDYLYISHLHRDHFDPDHLRRHVNTSATVLLPDFPTDELRDGLEDVGFSKFVTTISGRPVHVDGLDIMIVSLVSPADGPIGDSTLSISDGEHRVMNMNDARPTQLSPITDFGPYDLHLLQFSGAIWYPMVYDIPDAAKAEFGRKKRANGISRALKYVENVGARLVVGNAGPPAFLDDDLFALNDTLRDPANVFPDGPVFLEALAATGHEGGRLLLPGSVIDLCEDGSPVRHRSDDEVERVYGDKAAYLADYKARRAGELAAAHASWGAPEINILERLTEWLTPLLARANHICAGIDGPVLLDVGDEQIIVDFHTREVRAGQGEKCRYEFHVERRLIETCIRDHEIDWVNSLFLSCRFVAHRVGRYNEYLYTFFKCLSLERINYVEGWYAEAETSDEDIELGDWIVQRRCPHLKADLAEFGDIAGDVLVCRMHGWQFDLATGQSMTADGFPIRACRRT